MRLGLAFAVLFLFVCFPGFSAGVLIPQSVVCSGSYDEPFFGCQHLLDGLLDESVLVGGNSTYWLGRDGVSNETFTVDLGQVDLITGFNIYNSHNGQNAVSNDRGALTFTIWISTDPVTPDTTSSSFGTEVLSSPLSFYPFTNPSPLQEFSITPVYGRYVTFRTTDPKSFGGWGWPTNGAGLTEFQVEGVAPEPGTFLLAGLVLAALGLARRRR